MSDSDAVLHVLVDGDTDPYEEGQAALEGRPSDTPPDGSAVVRFPDESMLTDVFNEHTYRLLRCIRDENPASIRETARLVGRDTKNVYEDVTTLEALGVIQLQETGKAKQPVFPFEDLVVTPLTEPADGNPSASP